MSLTSLSGKSGALYLSTPHFEIVCHYLRMIRNGSKEEIDIERMSSYSEESDEDDDRLPVWFSILLLSSYTVLISVVVYLLDKGEYGEPG